MDSRILYSWIPGQAGVYPTEVTVGGLTFASGDWLPPPGGSQSPAGGAALSQPEAVAENYLASIGCSDYRTAADCLEHPKALA